MEAIAERPVRLTEIVDRLDCFTEADLRQLADVQEETPGVWRKRGEGPAYVRAGNRFLYPRAAVAEWLAARIQSRCQTTAKGRL